jgi:hypothetical protein
MNARPRHCRRRAIRSSRSTAHVEYPLNLFGLGLRFQTELRVNYYPLSRLALSEPSGDLVAEGLLATALTERTTYDSVAGSAT